MSERAELRLIHAIFFLILSLISFLFFYGFSNPLLNLEELEVNTTLADCTLGETDDLGQEYIDKIIFLGESTTYGLERYGLLDSSKIWTGATSKNGTVQSAGTLSLSPSIDKTRIYYSKTGEAITIGEAVNRDNPPIIIITLGLNNGVSYYSEDEFKACYRVLLRSVINASSTTKVILQSIFPVAASCQIKAFTPERIRLCNAWLQDIAREFGLHYLDTLSVLADDDGYLLSAYDNGGDGIHLNEAGLQAVLYYIRTHGITHMEVIS